MEEAEKPGAYSQEIEKLARNKAKQRAYTARWNLDIAIFAFAVLIAVVVLLFQDVRLEIVAPVAIVGLTLVWLAGWWHGRRLLADFYIEELEVLRSEVTKIQKKIVDESVEDMIQKALKDRRQ